MMAGTAATLTVLSWVRFFLAGRKLNLGTNWMPAGADIAVAACFIAAIVVSWYALRRAVAACGESGNQSRSEIWRIARFSFLLSLVAAPMLPMMSDDIFSMMTYVDLAFGTGVNPYTMPWPGMAASSFSSDVYGRWMNGPCIYGPIELAWWSPGVLLSGGSLPMALALTKVAAALTAMGLVALMASYCSRPDASASSTSMFALMALSPIVWLEGGGQASNELVPAFLLAAWLLTASRGRIIPAAALLGLAVASKLTMAVPAAMFAIYLLRPGNGSPARRLGDAALASLVMAGVVVAAYSMVWDGAQTILQPFTLPTGREPTNTLAEPFYVVATELFHADKAAWMRIVGLVNLPILLGLVAAAAWLAWRAKDFRNLVASMAMIQMLIVTVGTPVFHPWYLLPCLVLSVELANPAWRAWLFAASSLVIVVDGSVLLPLGSAGRIIFTVLTCTVACIVWLLHLRGRLSAIRAAASAP
jgi:hypothetical protein